MFLALAGAHGDPVASVALSLTVILLSAKLVGEIAVRLGQPAVLGEILAGVLLGNAHLVGFDGFSALRTDAAIDMLARIGVLLLLFEVGLESTVGQMLKVGLSSLSVAMIGVFVPFVLGWLTGAWLLPQQGPLVHAFLGATFCATSIGITARVLKDLSREKTEEARIVLGAAVIDDVLGLLILAVLSGVVAASNQGGTLAYGDVAFTLFKATAFLVVALTLGVYLSPRLFHLVSRLRARGALLAVGLGFCFLLAWLADVIGLSPIVGAFAAGLVLEDVHFRDFKERGEHGLEELVHPIASLLAPVFFVLMGLRTDLRALAAPGILGLAGVLTLVAIGGKAVAGLGAFGKGLDRLSIGIAMVPRGEVGLIFANVGLTLEVGGKPVIDGPTFSAVVVMVMLTTLVTPPALRFSLARAKRAK
jgi:Kef-type K+ transport system membrane component KefB